MKILSCNVNGRVGLGLDRQLRAVLARDPDVLALQEVTSSTYAAWCRGLQKAGYSVVSSVALLGLPFPPPPYFSPPFPRNLPGGPIAEAGQIQRKYFNLTAARHPISLLTGLSFEDRDEARFSFPEKYVAARIILDEVEVDVHNAHVPPGASRGLIKVHAFEAIRRRLDSDGLNPRILCGDFNAPGSEDASGPLIKRGGPWDDAARDRWVQAELSIVSNPDMRDVYRDALEPEQPLAASHFTGTRNRRTPRRYDHIFASRELQTQGCEYLSGWLEKGELGRLSDHAPVEATLRWRS